MPNIDIPMYAPDLMPGYDPTVNNALTGAGLRVPIRPNTFNQTKAQDQTLFQSAYGFPLDERLDVSMTPTPLPATGGTQNDVVNPLPFDYDIETGTSEHAMPFRTHYTETLPLNIVAPIPSPQPLIMAPLHYVTPIAAPAPSGFNIPVTITNPTIETKTPTATPTQSTTQTTTTTTKTTPAAIQTTTITNPTKGDLYLANIGIPVMGAPIGK